MGRWGLDPRVSFKLSFWWIAPALTEYATPQNPNVTDYVHYIRILMGWKWVNINSIPCYQKYVAFLYTNVAPFSNNKYNRKILDNACRQCVNQWQTQPYILAKTE